MIRRATPAGRPSYVARTKRGVHVESQKARVQREREQRAEARKEAHRRKQEREHFARMVPSRLLAVQPPPGYARYGSLIVPMRMGGMRRGFSRASAAQGGNRGVVGYPEWGAGAPPPTPPDADALSFPGFGGALLPEGVTPVDHIRDDWSTQTTIAELATVDRVDGMDPWSLGANSAWLSFESGTLDPWFGVKRLRQTIPPVNEGYAYSDSGACLQLTPNAAHVANIATQGTSLVQQFAFRCVNTNLYLGKLWDCKTYRGGYNWRWTHESWADPKIGSTTIASCDDDGLCSTYYADNGTTPLVEGIPSNVRHYGECQFAARENDAPQYLKQNINAVGGVAADPDDLEGGDWFLDTQRITQGPTHGYGRYEFWRTTAVGVTTKLLEYLGDAGQRGAGKMWMLPEDAVNGSDVGWYPGTMFQFFWLTSSNNQAGRWLGNSIMDIGGVRTFSHPRIDL